EPAGQTLLSQMSFLFVVVIVNVMIYMLSTTERLRQRHRDLSDRVNRRARGEAEPVPSVAELQQALSQISFRRLSLLTYAMLVLLALWIPLAIVTAVRGNYV